MIGTKRGANAAIRWIFDSSERARVSRARCAAPRDLFARRTPIANQRRALRIARFADVAARIFWRLWTKYILWNFHPLVFFYFAGMFLLAAGLLFGAFLIYSQLIGVGVSGPRAILDALLILTGLQFLLFAMLFDMQEGLELMPMNRRASDRTRVNMSKKIIILGTGGNCLDILDTLNDINSARGEQVYECIGFWMMM